MDRTLNRIHQYEPPPITIGIVYSAAVVGGCILVLIFNVSLAVLPILSIPLIVIAARYRRPLFSTLWLIWVMAAVGVAFARSVDSGLTFTAIILGGCAVYVLLELVNALVNARTQTQVTLEKRNRELAAVNQVTATITATLELDQVLRRLVDTVADLLPQVASVTLQTVDEDRDVLTTIVASAGTVPGCREEAVEFRPGEGIAGEAMAQQRSINVADVTSAPNYVPGVFPPSYRSLLVVPLVVGDRIWGTLSLSGDAVGAFLADDVRLVESLARQAAISIENAHLYQETLRNAREQEILSQIVRALNANLDVELAFPEVSCKLQALTGCGRVSLTLIDYDREQFKVVAMDSPIPGLDRGETFPWSASPSAVDLRAGRVRLTPDLTAQGESPIRKTLLQAGLRSAVSLPLVAGDRVLGGLNLASQQRDGFSESDLPILTQIADALAAAMVKSELFERVQAAEAQYRALFENSADAIVVVDFQGAVLDANVAACEILERRRAQVLGQQIQNLTDLPESSFKDASAKAQDGLVVTYGFSIMVSERQRYFEARLERMNQPDTAALQWIAHDVTDRRELDQWREELTDITVHNLRNPLTWVQTGVEAAKMFLPENIDPGVVFALDRALKGTARLEQQIDILLNINRAEAGQELTDKEPLDIHTIIDDVIELLKPRAGSRNTELLVDVPDSLPLIRGNRNMISWTLENLVDNAIKFSPENQPVAITISVNAQHITGTAARADGTLTHAGESSDERTADNKLWISVADRGPGIPASDRHLIFRKFTRARHGTQYKGAGMGLYFCRLAVEAHGGNIWFEANPDGPGSVFTFTLPF
jgi:NtrC-family two-component system sensor histidine kinase KinB